MCGGMYKIQKVVKKGLGGALQAQAICDACNFVINYGDPKFVPSSALPTKMSLGRELMLSHILIGRPLHTAYEKLFGNVGMDTYSTHTFQRGVETVAAAVDRRQYAEVSAIASSPVTD